MTKREGAILTAFTGILCGPMEELYVYAEKLFNRPVYTHEFGNESFMKDLKEKNKLDFVKLCESQKE